MMMTTTKGTILDATGKPFEFPVADRFTSDGPAFIDHWRGQRAPSDKQLVERYKELVYVMANLNAQTFASSKIRLFVSTAAGQRSAQCETRSVTASRLSEIESAPQLARWSRYAKSIDEVIEHPLLDLLETANPILDGFVLRELTDLYQEVVGSAYWLIEVGPLGIPSSIWILPAHKMTLKRTQDGTPAYYEFGSDKRRIDITDLVVFRFPNLADPYGSGWSPARAAYETANLLDLDNSFARALMENRARPDVIISPKQDGIGSAMAERLERRFNRKLRNKGSGAAVVMDEALNVDTLTMTSKDLEALARHKVSKTTLANAFGIPIPLLEGESINRATLEAAKVQHGTYAIRPRLSRFCQVLNQTLLPRFDARLFVWFDDPVPQDSERQSKVLTTYIKHGVVTPNEAREELNRSPEDGGDVLYVSGKWTPLKDSRQEPQPKP